MVCVCGVFGCGRGDWWRSQLLLGAAKVLRLMELRHRGAGVFRAQNTSHAYRGSDLGYRGTRNLLEVYTQTSSNSTHTHTQRNKYEHIRVHIGGFSCFRRPV